MPLKLEPYATRGKGEHGMQTPGWAGQKKEKLESPFGDQTKGEMFPICETSERAGGKNRGYGDGITNGWAKQSRREGQTKTYFNRAAACS